MLALRCDSRRFAYAGVVALARRRMASVHKTMGRLQNELEDMEEFMGMRGSARHRSVLSATVVLLFLQCVVLSWGWCSSD